MSVSWEDHAQSGPQTIYCPAIAIDCITLHHTMGRLAVTALGDPRSLCGVAKRVGYTGTSDTDLALYRLKLKRKGQRIYSTLPSFFVVERGIFLEYEQWLSRQEQDEEIPLVGEENHATSPYY